MELSRLYFQENLDKLLSPFLTDFPGLKGQLAAGLVGEGSQCFGYDDAISQDHDFAPGFCIWLTDSVYEEVGTRLQESYDRLPSEFMGFSRSNVIAKDRLGVMKISEFYSRFTGVEGGVPQSLMDWLMIPEPYLATATNGQVFLDECGEFTEIRRQLLNFYPEDVRRKKIAARAAIMSQAGQYNLLRVIDRQDMVATLLSLGRFTEAAMSMFYLLDRRYMPFYKWAFRGLSQLPLLPDQLLSCFTALAKIPSYLEEKGADYAHRLAFQLTDSICGFAAAKLNRQGISQVHSDFLQDHLADIMDGIEDPQIRSLHPMIDCAG
jgi:hypothetical protein